MAEKPDDTLATSPKDPVTGGVKPLGGPSARPGTEAEQAAQDRGEPPKPAKSVEGPDEGPDEPPPGRRNRASPADGT